ncbi:MAG: hypothetical protein AB7G11_08665 [Phycisphaerales bacterium]
MSIIDWLVLALTILCLAEAIREARRKEWTAFAMSIIVFLILVYWWRPMWIYIYKSLTGTP